MPTTPKEMGTHSPVPEPYDVRLRQSDDLILRVTVAYAALFVVTYRIAERFQKIDQESPNG